MKATCFFRSPVHLRILGFILFIITLTTENYSQNSMYSDPLLISTDTGMLSTMAASALDKSGNLHIVFVGWYYEAGAPDEVASEIFYTNNISGEFIGPVKLPEAEIPFEPLFENDFYYSKKPSITVDSCGVVHVAYYRTETQLNGSSWICYTNNKIGSFSIPHLLYFDPLDSNSKYYSYGNHIMLCAGTNNDSIHIVFDGNMGTGHGGARYSAGLDGIFKKPLAYTESSYKPTITFDNNGTPNIVFWMNSDTSDIFSNVNLVTSKISNGNFSKPEVLYESESSFSQEVSFAFDGYDSIHVVFRNLDLGIFHKQMQYIKGKDGVYSSPIEVPNAAYDVSLMYSMKTGCGQSKYIAYKQAGDRQCMGLMYDDGNGFKDISPADFDKYGFMSAGPQHFLLNYPKKEAYYTYTTNQIYMVTIHLNSPSAPTNHYPDSAGTDQPTTITLSWKPPDFAETYSLQVSTTNDFSNIVIEESDIEETSIKITGLENETKYYWRVNAANSHGTGEWSGIWNFTTTAGEIIDCFFHEDFEDYSPGILANATGSPWVRLSSSRVGNVISTDEHTGDQCFQINSFTTSTETDYVKLDLDVKPAQVNLELWYHPDGFFVYKDFAEFGLGYAHSKFDMDKVISLWGDEHNVYFSAEGLLEDTLLFNELEYDQYNFIKLEFDFQNNEARMYIGPDEQAPLCAKAGFNGTLDINALYFSGGLNPTFIDDICVTIEGEYILPAPQKPTPVSPVNGSDQHNIFLILSWDPSFAADFYHLQVDDANDFDTPIYDEDSLTSNSFQISNLNYNRIYYWRVRAQNEIGASNWSDSWNFKTASADVCKLDWSGNDPQIYMEYINENNYKFKITLNNIGYCSEMSIQISSVKIDEDISINFFYPNWGSLNGTISEDGNSYSGTYNIGNHNCSGSKSGAWSVYRLTPHTEKPFLLSPTDDSYNQPLNITLSWEEVENASGYNIEVSKMINFSSVEFAVSDTLTNQCDLSNLEHNTTYYWKIGSLNTCGEISWSDIQKFTTIPENIIAPILSAPEDGSIDQPIKISLSWNDIEDAETYNLQVSTSHDFSNTIFNETNIFDTFKELSGLTHNTMYYWRVSASNANGTGEWSEIWNFTTTAGEIIDCFFHEDFEDYSPGILANATGSPWVRLSSSRVGNVISTDEHTGDQCFQINSFTTSTETDYVKLDLDVKPAQVNLELWYHPDGFFVYKDFAEFGLGYAHSKFDMDKVISLRGNEHNVYFSAEGLSEDTLLFNELEYDQYHFIKLEFDFQNNEARMYIGPDEQAPLCAKAGFNGTLDINALYFSGGLNPTFIDDICVTIEGEYILPTPQKPALLSPVNGSDQHNIFLILSWDPSFSADFYHLQVDEADDFNSPLYDINNLSATSYQIADLSYNETYYWRIRAGNVTGESVWSDSWSFSTMANSI